MSTHHDETAWYAIISAELEGFEEEERENLLAGAGAAYILHSALESARQRAERRREQRLYITRPELMPNPRIDTPWQVLHTSRSDRAFITTMGFDVSGFELILESGFMETWNTMPIPRNDAPGSSAPRLSRRSLDAAGALGLALHYLNSTIYDTSLVEIFALIPSTVSRYIDFSLEILLDTLRAMPKARIEWPHGDQFEENNGLIVARHPRLTGAFGSLDGLKLPVQTSTDQEIENATYNGWLHEHFISNVLAFNPKGEIIAARLNAPGSWHDSRVAKPIYEKLATQTPDGFYLVADTAFPQGASHISGTRICAPSKASSQRREGDHGDKGAFERELLSYRQTAEWGMRAMQGSFGRLRVPLPIKHIQRRGTLLEVCCRLLNLRARTVGYNQIRSVYMPLWEDSDGDARLQRDFEKMLFGDQLKTDRVSKFHKL